MEQRYIPFWAGTTLMSGSVCSTRQREATGGMCLICLSLNLILQRSNVGFRLITKADRFNMLPCRHIAWEVMQTNCMYRWTLLRIRSKHRSIVTLLKGRGFFCRSEERRVGKASRFLTVLRQR